MNSQILKQKPFNLNDDQIHWVEDTINSMTLDEKIGQLFLLANYTGELEYVRELNEKYHCGGWMARPMKLENVIPAINEAQKTAKIPLLIAANLEAGGDGLVEEGTNVAPNIQIGAVNDPEYAAKQAYVCAREADAVGANYAFAPVIDIDYNFRNPIIATRSFGTNVDFVSAAGKAFVKAAQERDLAVSIKHFPGDGIDERDQHLVTTVNSLSCDEWDKTYGKVYADCIEAGAYTVMAAHIMLPEYSRQLCPGIKDEDILPASLSKELLNGLLREKMNFNGLIISDASPMSGMCIPMSRQESVPGCIAAGCDMLLFTRNQEEDFAFMKKGYEDGIITPERLEEALLRILGLKAALHLPEKKASGAIYKTVESARQIVGCQEHKQIEAECADKGITLVKNTEKLLPISSKTHKRVLLYNVCNMQPEEVMADMLRKELEKEGFEVSLYQESGAKEGYSRKDSEWQEKYDLILCAADYEPISNQTTIRMNWDIRTGADIAAHGQTIPTIFVSFSYPYHLLDVPRVKTYINAYKFKAANVQALVQKLVGKSEFKGCSPVDPFCGMWDTRL